MSKNRHLTFEKGALNIQRRRGGEGVRPHPTHPFRYATDLITRNLYVAQIQRLIVWSLWPVVKHKSIANLWESVFSVFWFYNAWENWTCRIGWTITYHSLEVFSYEFYSHLNGYLNRISVPCMTKLDKTFGMGIAPLSCSHSLRIW